MSMLMQSSKKPAAGRERSRGSNRAIVNKRHVRLAKQPRVRLPARHCGVLCSLHWVQPLQRMVARQVGVNGPKRGAGKRSLLSSSLEEENPPTPPFGGFFL